MANLALLLARLTVGGLVAGHGSQKLFGWFGGHGMRGTQGMVESLGLRPSTTWSWLAALSEFGGGALTVLGLFNPVGPLALIGSMAMATATAHRGKPIWVTSGGAELPITNMAMAAELLLAGPGALALDEALGTGLPRWVAIPGLALVAGAILAGVPAPRLSGGQGQDASARPQTEKHAEPSVA